MEVIKYKGTDKYIVGLVKDREQKYIFFAEIDSILLNNEEEEELDAYSGLIKYISSKKYTIEFLLKLEKDNSFIHFLEIKDEKEYDTICKILEIIL